MKTSKSQLRRDRTAILTVLRLAAKPVTFAQISLQAGEDLLGALWSLRDDGTIAASYPDGSSEEGGKAYWSIVNS